MKLRSKLALTLGLLVVPLALTLAWVQQRWRLDAAERATAEAVQARMEAGGRERCEILATLPPPFERMGRHGAARGLRGHGIHGPRLSLYDARLEPSQPGGPPMDPKLRGALEKGADVASARIGGRGGRAQLLVAVRMPWADGPCAIVVVRRSVPGVGAWSAVAVPLLVSLAAVLMAMLAAGPLVRRVRKLTAMVRGSHGTPDAPIALPGRDEIAELAAEFEASRARDRAQMAALRDRDATLTDYVANTTHDLMIPLTVLQGHLVAMREQAAAGMALEPQLVRAAIEESHHIASIVQNLSAAAKLEAGAPHIELHPVDLNALVERVAGRHAPVAKQKGVELAHAVPADVIYAQGDVTLLEQAVRNLVHNAVRYTEPGGHVALALETMGDGRFRIRVADDGPGIPPAELERVTERRFRGGEARQRHPHGLGLGLHIVRDVADRHGFELVFDSPPGGGLTVELRGPRLEGLSAGAA